MAFDGDDLFFGFLFRVFFGLRRKNKHIDCDYRNKQWFVERRKCELGDHAKGSGNLRTSAWRYRRNILCHRTNLNLAFQGDWKSFLITLKA